MLVLGVLDESINGQHCSARVWRIETYAGAFVVLRKVDLQITHWMSQAWAF